MSALPADVVTETLLKLPAKSLLRFKNVCKLWHDLIDDSVFMNRHVEQSNMHIIFRTPDDDVHMCDFDTLDNPRNLNFPFKNWKDTRLSMVGSCRGLICFSMHVYPHITFLYNPTTQTRKTLPPLPKNSAFYYRKGPTTKCLVFGYDHLSEDYKCVMIEHNHSSFKSQVMVYSLRRNTWRPRAVDAPCYFYGYLSQFTCFVVLNGVVHWAIERIHRTSLRIVGFNLTNEALSFVPLHNSGSLVASSLFSLHNYGSQEQYVCVHPGVIDSCLCLIYNYLDYSDVWIMKEYGVASSWTRVCRVGYRPEIMDLRPISFSKSTKELLLVQTGKENVATLDLKTREITIFQPPGFHRLWGSFVCSENLLVLKDGEYVPRGKHQPRNRNRNRKFKTYY